MRKFNFKIFAVILPLFTVTAIFIYSLLATPFSSKEIFCFTNRVSGIKCPSCGLTRAVWCILHWQWEKAFYYHALFTVGIIPFTLCLTGMGVNFYLGKRVLPLPKYRWIYFYLTLGALVVFTVIRNLTPIIY
ncbi:MAG: DUF2752 domain-containing protein [Clostridiales bacterium]|nr:DUF2752 domain-containing protein [Clostridiales bacterium]